MTLDRKTLRHRPFLPAGSRTADLLPLRFQNRGQWHRGRRWKPIAGPVAPTTAVAPATTRNSITMEKRMAQTQTEKSASPTDQSGKEGSGTKSTAANSEPITNAEDDPIAMLSADHRKVEKLFAAFEKATDGQQKSQLAEQICTELSIHTLVEEEIFYPACRGHVEDRMLKEAQVEHDGAKALIIEIMSGSPQDEYFDAKIKVLSDEIKHHVREEEPPGSGICAMAKQAGAVNPDLAKRMAERKQQLTEEAKAGVLGPPQTRSFRVQTHAGMKRTSQEPQMTRSSSSTLDRDERGRFVSDDDDRDYRRRSSSRSRYDDDDDDRRMPARDDEGRFVSSRSRRDDDDDRRSSRSRYADDDRRSMRARDEEGRFTSARSRRDDDDDRRGSRGHGGWVGDPEGHSEASRRGREERGGARYRDDDDDRRYSRSRRDDDDDRRGSRGHGGWFGDPEGHSEAARRGREEGGGARYRDDDDDDRRYARSRMSDDDRRGSRGHGGWFGDPEGHSEASRRGWEERGASRSRYRDDDDDDGRRRSRGHGGWYGDSEGHSEAARRGRR